jgi:hypothetical protein
MDWFEHVHLLGTKVAEGLSGGIIRAKVRRFMTRIVGQITDAGSGESHVASVVFTRWSGDRGSYP